MAELHDALAHLEADSRDQWVEVGAALHPYGEQGLKLWVEWSQRSSKFNWPDQMRVWNSFRDDRAGVTVRTLYGKAQAHGWVNPRANPAVDSPSAPINEGVSGAAPPPPPGSRLLRDRARVPVTFKQPAPRSWVLQDWLPCRATSVLHADGGAGKTRVFAQLAIATAVRLMFAHIPVTHSGRVLFVSAEEDEESLARVMHEVAVGMGLTEEQMAQAASLIDVLDLTGEPNQILYGALGMGRFGLTPLGQEVVAYAREVKPALLGIDNSTLCYAGPPTEQAHIAAYLNTWRNVVRECNGAALSLMHEAKASLRGARDSHAYSGVAAWNNCARQRLEMYRPDDEDGVRILRRAKSNYGPVCPKGEGLRLVWQGGIFIREVEGGMVERIKRANDVRVVVDLVAQAIAAGQNVSPELNANNNARKLAKAFGVKLAGDRIDAAVREAIRTGALVVEAYKNHYREFTRLVLGKGAP